MQENTDQKNSEHEHFSHSDCYLNIFRHYNYDFRHSVKNIRHVLDINFSVLFSFIAIRKS